MKLNTIKLHNFRCFEEQTFILHPEFNLIVGTNGTGKTALLDAISVAIATWLLGFKRRNDKKSLEASDARLIYVEKEGEPQFVESWPVTVTVAGVAAGVGVSWERSKDSPTGNTRYGQASELIALAKQCDQTLAQDIALPLISYYGTMRLWQDPRQSKVEPAHSSKGQPSRLDGYKHCVDPRIAIRELVAWFARQEWQSFQLGKETTMLKVVRNAIIACIENAENIRYDPKRKELLLTLNNGDPQPFSLLSDGLRCVIALVADMAQKAALLNPHMGEGVLQGVEGVVLVDELDLHLHPRWQRRLTEDLRRVFPKIQFICTTHSPFLIQSLRSGEELIMLDGTPTAELANKPLEDIAVGIMGVNSADVSQRYDEMKGVALEYLKALDTSNITPQEKLIEFKQRLAERIAPYADNPAYQAFLEMQRIVKIGS